MYHTGKKKMTVQCQDCRVDANGFTFVSDLQTRSNNTSGTIPDFPEIRAQNSGHSLVIPVPVLTVRCHKCRHTRKGKENNHNSCF